jgi:sugar phosphate isomerase/epimerase
MALKVGLQLFSVKNSMAANPLEAIEKVGKLGYKFVEFANHNASVDFGCGFGVEASDMKRILDSYGMKAISAHISPLTLSNADQVIEYYHTLDCTNLVNSADFFESKEDVLRKCEQYNKLGEKLKSSGIHYLYHNHFHEFQKFEGEYVLEIMKNNVDPEYVGFQLDTYWAMRGGADPVEIMKKFGKSIKLIHQKDFSKDIDIPVNIFSFIDPNQKFDFNALMTVFKTKINNHEQQEAIVEIGTGKMDIQSILNTASEYTDTKYVILEQDYTTHDEIESIRISMESFKKFQGIAWE